MSDGLWLYALVPSGTPVPPVPAVDPAHAVRAIDLGRGIDAWVSAVDTAAFTGPAAEERLADLATIQPLVLRHHGVIHGAGGAVVAMRFATLFHDEASLREGVAPTLAAVATQLERLRGCREWSVKGWLDRHAAVGPAPRSADSGAAYLRARQAHRDALTAVGAAVDRWSDELAEHLEPLARDATSRPVVGGDDPRGEMVWNWAFLIPVGQEGPFLEALDAVQPPPGVALGVGGPLPPYSFGQGALG